MTATSWGDREFSVIDPVANSIYSDREPTDEFKQYYKGGTDHLTIYSLLALSAIVKKETVPIILYDQIKV